MAPVTPQFEFKNHSATKAAVCSGEVVIYGILVSANGAAADVQLIDALTDTGGDELEVYVLDGDTRFLDFTDFGGIIFSTGLSLTMSAGYVALWTSKAQITA